MKKIFDEDAEMLEKIAKLLNECGYDNCQKYYNEILFHLVEINERIEIINED